jgi:hypothetical protein
MSDEHTPITCRSCLGNSVGCRHCGYTGQMTPEQLLGWKRFESGLRKKAGGEEVEPDRTPTRRFDPHRVLALDRLARCWDKVAEKHPRIQLGVLLSVAMRHARRDLKELELLTDEQLLEIVEHFALLGTLR